MIEFLCGIVFNDLLTDKKPIIVNNNEKIIIKESIKESTNESKNASSRFDIDKYFESECN